MVVVLMGGDSPPAKRVKETKAQNYRIDMERAVILSEILRDQIRSGAPRESLLWTLGMIRTEILGMPSKADGSTGVDISPPDGALYGDSAFPGSPSPAPVVGLPEEPLPKPLPSGAAAAFGTSLSESPTDPPIPSAGRGHQHTAAEVNQRVAEGGASLNDLLRQDGRDLSERLVPEAVADLRRAFGINDRFLFINELFAGDALVFDEVVQRLNGMQGLPEAVAWLDRELGPRLGWNSEDPLVRQLHQLLSRRFSAI